MEKRKGIEFPTADGERETIVAMITHKGVIYVATQHRMYYEKDGDMHPVYFINEPNATE